MAKRGRTKIQNYTPGVTRSRKSKMGRQYNDQKGTTNKGTNNNLKRKPCPIFASIGNLRVIPLISDYPSAAIQYVICHIHKSKSYFILKKLLNMYIFKTLKSSGLITVMRAGGLAL